MNTSTMFDGFDPIPTYDSYYNTSPRSSSFAITATNSIATTTNNYYPLDMVIDDASESSGSISSILTNKYCTPRSLSRVQSIESEIDDIPLNFKPNIWSPNYKTGYSTWLINETEILARLDNFNFNNYHHYNNMNNNNNGIPSDPSSPLTSNSMTTTTSIPGMNDVSALVHTNFNKLIQAGSQQQPVPPPPAPPPNCLTFRSYKSTIFTVPKNSKFFVIKSYNILDVNASFTHNIWTSTELGNKRLDKAYKELQISGNPDYDGKIFLFFSVNSSGKFCGIAEMKSSLDYEKTSDIWVEQTRWKGIFPVEWLLIKDVPNRFFQHLKIPSNENKPVTNSRDTQEIPFDIGISMLKIISSFRTNE
ncbi:uncharacterized protein J8A68_003953 [[Candida] subhashii]|uniref:YTH domain-containing protein n=1 Tax=[Candida] subhashii TaxID=561895 RepID=A0A8J5Q7G9_9ASCO|nr:uncharacterized protein J8A68_003953 [[Candida] subhashii]KAG7662534.1 hypothetical protein J8A68_003953 [[Candida] subhashii]